MQHADILALAGLRVDGRLPNEIRCIKYAFGVLPRYDGSASLEMGLTKVMVAVSGPQEPIRRSDARHDRGFITCSLHTAPFAGNERRRKRGASDRRSTDLEAAIANTFSSAVILSHYPRTQLHVIVHVLESDGGVLPACINAVSLALADAGVATTDLVVACAAARTADDRAVADPSQLEQSASSAYLPLAVLARSQSVLLARMDARLSLDGVEEVLEAALEGCRRVHREMDAAVRDRVARRLAAAAPEGGGGGEEG